MSKEVRLMIYDFDAYAFSSSTNDVNGVKMPYSITFSWLDGRDGFQLTDVKTNVPIDQAVFGRPKRAVKN